VFTRLARVGEKARTDKEVRFTNLLSLLKVPLLSEAYQRTASGRLQELGV
jgi:hypothetical protein